MSTRIKALDYITQEFNHQGFIPFVQERNHRGQLIKQTKTFEPLEATEEPIPQQTKSQISKSTLDPLFYLMDQKEELNTMQLLMLSDILLQPQLKVPAISQPRSGVITKLQLSKIEQYNEMKPLDKVRATRAYKELLGVVKERAPVHRSLDMTVPRPSARVLPRLNLVSKHLEGSRPEYLDYSLDVIKPKSIVNCKIVKTGSYQKREVHVRQPRGPRYVDETDHMFERMLQDINKQVSCIIDPQVRMEQRRNANTLLSPVSKFTYREVDADFAVENYQKMKSQLKQVQEYRSNLRKLSKKMEDIVVYRRYGDGRE